jgi:hypothetical protein
MVRVLLGRVLGMLDGVQLVAVRKVRVVARLLMVARFSVVGGLAMMLGGVLVVLRGFVVMMMDVVVAHGVLLSMMRNGTAMAVV